MPAPRAQSWDPCRCIPWAVPFGWKWLCLAMAALCPGRLLGTLQAGAWGSTSWVLIRLPNQPGSSKESRWWLRSLRGGGGGSLALHLSCRTTFLHLLSFNVLIKWLIREVIHEKDGYLDKAQKLVAALSPQISILHERERQKRLIFVPLSFHQCSSKDQSLQKINLKENF